jgi:hypothetical protein
MNSTISIGHNNSADNLLLSEFTVKTNQIEGFILKTVGQNLIIRIKQV